MSKATKRKHVTKEVLDEFVLPTPEQSIVKVVASRGNNLHEVEDSSGDKFLVSMPTKFRKNIWIKRGDFVLTAPIEEGDKVKAEIINILYKDQINYIRDEGLWPKAFEEDKKEDSGNLIPDDMLPPSDSEEDSEDDNEVGKIANPNRPAVQFEESESSESDENDPV